MSMLVFAMFLNVEELKKISMFINVSLCKYHQCCISLKMFINVFLKYPILKLE